MVNQVQEKPQASTYQQPTKESFARRTTKMFSGAINSIKKVCAMDIAVDLGTCFTVISLKGQGVVLNEPTVIAVDKRTRKIVNDGDAVGKVAHAMEGKTPRSIKTLRPMRDGVISDFEAAEAMLASFIRKVKNTSKYTFVKPRVTIAVPSKITQVQKRAVIDSAERIGASKVFLVDEPLAAGIGAGLPIASPTSSMIIDIGGGTTEIAVISLADIAASTSVPVAGNAMDTAIIEYIKKRHNLDIGPQRAEQLKKDLGSAAPLSPEMKKKVLGRDSSTGLPRTVSVTSKQVREALKPVVAEILDAIVKTLHTVDPELAADLIDNGIHICGGGSLLRNIDQVIQTATGIDVIRVAEPMLAVARGTQTYMENIDRWLDAANHLN